LIGFTISHYRIEAELGRGGMGVVYRAFDERLGRSVAVKVVSEQVADDTERRVRILAEARAAAPLNHPSIATIYEVGEDGEQLFIVMELLEGKTLRRMISEGLSEPRIVTGIVAQLAEALAAAHAQGVVHGDVKPENVVVQPDGRVKLMDFGIARQLASEATTVTHTDLPNWPRESEFAGTLAYTAPERYRGEPSDARADLFSLGVVLYEMVAGRRPFLGLEATALATQILNDSPRPLGEVAPGVPAELAQIARKLLEKQPEFRYQSAREAQVDLSNLLRRLELGAILPAVPGRRAVAVLPFKLLTPESQHEYLSVALADAVVNQLSASGDLLVRPISAVLRYARQPSDPLLTARELDVQVLVDGSIQKLGLRLRVHVQAWNATDGSTLLSIKRESEVADLFALQDSLAGELVKALGSKHAPTAGEPPTKSAVAYEMFLRGVERLSRWNRWDTRAAIEMLEEATRLDRQFADAWASLAEAYRQMGAIFEPQRPWLRHAERAARRALILDPANADAKCVRGRILWTPPKRFQVRAALRTLCRALELNPGCGQARVERCCILYHVGLHDEAKEGLTEALAINPDDATALAYMGQTALFAGDYERADDFHERALRIDPTNIWASLFGATVPLYRQQSDRAATRIRKARQILPDEPLLLSLEALLMAKGGDKRKTAQAIQKALRGGKSVSHRHHVLHNAAAAYALIGKSDQAISLLREAARTGLPNYLLFRDDPHFNSLRQLSRFVRLLADLKREWESYRKEFGGARRA
jgi:serine/threonine protein kinase/Tfp pilus assembly protein PilF